MKIRDIIAMREAGVLNATSHELNSTDAYRFFKLKKEINRAVAEIGEKEKSLFQDVEIEDPEKFINELNALRNNPSDNPEKLSEYNKKWIRLNELLNEMHNDDMSLDISKISYESWRILQNENRELKIGDSTRDVFSGYVEMILEGEFWEAPEE